MHQTLLRAVFALFATPLAAADFEAAPADIKVMSYNVRFGTAKDGENHWEKRKEFLVESIKTFAPNLLGTQETLDFQRDFIAAALPGHEVLGVGREDGSEKGEMTPLFWRKDRFEKVDGGHFWLSETPADAGSKGWDTGLPRMASWVKLADKLNPNKPLLWINTHFDNTGKLARTESSRLIRERLTTLGKECSLIVTGDFNAGEGSEPYRALFAPVEDSESPVVDSLRAVHPTRGENERTTTPFQSVPTKGARIDWIGVSRDWKIISAAIEHPDREGRTPSDHFPVTTVLRR